MYIFCFIYKAVISFPPTHRPERAAGERDGEEGGGQRARRDTKRRKRDINRSDTKDSEERIDGIGERKYREVFVNR